MMSALKYRMGQETGGYIKVCDPRILCHRKAIYTSKCLVLYRQKDWCFEFYQS